MEKNTLNTIPSTDFSKYFVEQLQLKETLFCIVFYGKLLLVNDCRSDVSPVNSSVNNSEKSYLTPTNARILNQ